MKKLMSIFIVIIILFNGCVEKKTNVSYSNSRDYPIYGVNDLPKDLILLNNLDMRYNDALVNLFEGLVKKNSEGNIVPALAKSWTVNDDNTVYTFKIRNDLNWSNGDEITAEDFVEFFSQILSSSIDNIYDYQLFCIFGAEDYKKGKIDIGKTGIRSVNDEVLEIRLNVPCNHLLDILSNPIYVLRKFDDNLKNWVLNYDKILFSGAYKIKYMENERIELEKNSYYWDKGNVVRDKVVVVNNKNSESSLAAFQSFKVDCIISPPLSEIKTLRDKDYINEISTNSGKIIAFNFRSDKINKNKDLRNSINNSIDKKKICDNVLYDTGEPWEENVQNSIKASIKDKNDEKIDYKNLKILCIDDMKNKRIAEELKKDLKINLDIDLQVILCENYEFINKAKEKENDLILTDFTMEYKNKVSYYEKFLAYNYFNFFNYKNKEYDSIIHKAKAEVNKLKQEELFKKGDKILAEDRPVINLYIEKYVVCKNKKISSMETNYDGNMLLSRLYYSFQ